MLQKQSMLKSLFAALTAMILTAPAFAGEASLVVPNIKAENPFSYNLLVVGLIVSVIGVIFGLIEFLKVKKVEVHEAMNAVGNTIFETARHILFNRVSF